MERMPKLILYIIHDKCCDGTREPPGAKYYSSRKPQGCCFLSINKIFVDIWYDLVYFYRFLVPLDLEGYRLWTT